MNERSVCESVVRQLWPYVDSAIPEVDRERVEAHLEMCAGCASHFEFAREFLGALAASRSDSVDERLRARVMNALAGAGFSSPV